MKDFFNTIFRENPVFCLLLGLCPALAVTTTVESSLVMGLCVLLVLLFSSLIISSIKKIVPDNVKIPVFIIIIGTFVTILELILSKYASDLYSILNIYLPLIVVNCIVLGRSISVYSKNSILKSLKDGLGIGIGYTLALILIGFIREILGNGSITLMDKLSSLTGYRAIYNILPININLFLTPAGAFLTLGLVLALINFFKGGKKHESN